MDQSKEMKRYGGEFIQIYKNNYLLPHPDFADFESSDDYLMQECYKRLYSGIHKGETRTKLLLMEEFLPIKDIID